MLDGQRVRLWALAAGRPDEQGYLLGLGASDPHVWEAAGAVLARAGLAAAFVGPRASGPAYRLTGRRRLARLREYVGDPPAEPAAAAWPREA